MNYKEPAGSDGEHWFVGSMQCRRTGQHGAAVRILPMHPDLVDHYEMGLILWESTVEKPEVKLVEQQPVAS